MTAMIAKVMLIAGVLVATSTAWAAPPPLRPLDLATIHGVAEQARVFARALDPPPPNAPTTRYRLIVIDPGHGGENEGAVGVGAIHEKYLTLELAYALRDALEARYPQARVVLTRYWDREVGLQERTLWANAIEADVFVSLHYNAATHDRAVGYETYFLASEAMAQTAEAGNRRKQAATVCQKQAFRALDRARVQGDLATRALLAPAHEQSQALATLVQGALARELSSVNRGVKEANFAVLRGARMPAIVVESGFLTHPEEGLAVLAADHRAAVVRALVDALVAFDGAAGPGPEPVAQRLR